MQGNGKKIAEEAHSQRPTKAIKTEKGSTELPSTAIPATSKLTCSNCSQNKPLSDLLFAKICHHSFCSTCSAIYVSEMVGFNAAAIACPSPGCKGGVFEPELCEPVIAREVFDHWCLSLCVAAVEAKFYCPFKDCAALLADERGGREVIAMAECPHCRRLFCAQCESAWHEGMSCENFQRMGKK